MLYNNYKLGYGVMRMQAAEHKNKQTKKSLKLTNQKISNDSNNNKFYQILRREYVKLFYYRDSKIVHRKNHCSKCEEEGHIINNQKCKFYCICKSCEGDVRDYSTFYCDDCDDL